MKFHRIYAVLLRHFYLFKRSLDRMTDAFYWPVVDLVLWGLTSSYLSSSAEDSAKLVLGVVSGILFWLIVYRGQLEISISLLEDLWNKNLINFFVAPLRFSEWIFSFMILAFLKAILSFVFGLVVAFFLYKIDFFAHGFSLLVFTLPLILAAWWSGFFLTGLILRYGTKIQSFGWTLIWIIAPFSAVYYPVSALPHWAQVVAGAVPTSYVFEGMREVIATGVLDPYKLVLSIVLNILFCVVGFAYLHSSFKKVLQKGLVKVY